MLQTAGHYAIYCCRHHLSIALLICINSSNLHDTGQDRSISPQYLHNSRTPCRAVISCTRRSFERCESRQPCGAAAAVILSHPSYYSSITRQLQVTVEQATMAVPAQPTLPFIRDLLLPLAHALYCRPIICIPIPNQVLQVGADHPLPREGRGRGKPRRSKRGNRVWTP